MKLEENFIENIPCFRRRNLTERIISFPSKIAISAGLTLSRTSEKFSGQVNDTSRLVEMFLDSILKFNLCKVSDLSSSLANWYGEFMKTKKEIADKDKIVVYTDAEYKLPINQKKYGRQYDLMVIQPFLFGSITSRLVPQEDFNLIIKSFLSLNEDARKCFLELPATMARPREYNSLPLSIMQILDPSPHLLFPSGHIANAGLFDFLGKKYLKGKKAEPVRQSLEYSMKHMVSVVLGTGQHAYIDVAGGLLCAQNTIKKYFNEDIKNLNEQCSVFRKETPEIDFDLLFRIKDELEGLISENNCDLAKAGKIYFARNGYPKVPADFDTNHHYFDRTTRELVHFD